MTDGDNPPGGGHRGRKFRGKRLKTALPKPAAAEAQAAPERSGERIAKAMARAGLCSRREAEAWIAAGRVSVNGERLTSAARNITPQDRVTVDGEPLPQRERTRLFLFHKPRGLITTSADTHDRPTIFGALPKDMPRVISVGRLDLNTEGLLLLTNDGGLARALELPSTGWLRRYRVRAFGKVEQARLDGLRNGIVVDGVRYGAIEATLDHEQGSNVWLTFAMREGKNREIRNVLGALGLQVNRLIRVSYGPFQLGELQPAEVTEIRTRALREQLGERLASQAGADFSGPIGEPVDAVAPPPPRREVAPSKRETLSLPRQGEGEGRRDHDREGRRGGERSDSGRPPHRKQVRTRDEGSPHRSEGHRPKSPHRPGSERRDGPEHRPRSPHRRGAPDRGKRRR
jgi:23S rRNA pseudouridine2605 synthase